MAKSLRTMPVPTFDAQGNKTGTTRVAYEPVIKWERMKLVKGTKEYFILGSKSTAAEDDRNYEITNPNPLETRSGYILGLFAELNGVANAAFNPALTAGGKVAADHWNLLRSGMSVETFKDKERYQHDHGSVVLPAMPAVYKGTGNEPALYDLNNDGSYLDRTSQKRGIVWKRPPIKVGYQTTFYVKVTFKDDPDDVLANHVILWKLPTREVPSARADHGE